MTAESQTDRLYSQQQYETVFLGLSILLLVSLLYSVFMLSVVMICFGLFALFKVEWNPLRFSWRGNFPLGLPPMMDQPAWWLLTVPFFLVLVGAFYSDDTAYWLTRIRIKLPFVLFPMAFFLLPSISRHCYHRVHLALLIVMSISTLPIIWSMVLEYDQILLRLQQGRPIATPGNHIRYSLLVALSSISGFLLCRRGIPLSPLIKKLSFVLSVGLVLFLHVLAVRSGLLALYLMGLVLILRQVYKKGLNLKTGLLMLSLLAIPWVAYQSIPSLQSRVHYMFEDVSKYQEQKWNAYSDAERMLSIKAGVLIGADHWLIGVGPGDLKDAMRTFFYEHFDKDSFILPHNQFVTVFAANGIIGLFLFILCLFVPLWSNKHYRNEWYLSAYIAILASLLVENTFETSMGVAIFIFFILTGLNHMKNPRNLS